MTERKVIKAKKKAIRRARLKKVGTVAAMLPLVMSKGAPVATLIRGRHDEEVPGIEQVVDVPEQEIADVVLPEIAATEADEEEAEMMEEEEAPDQSDAPTTFEAPQTFTAPNFSESGMNSFAARDSYLGISALNKPWNDWNNRENWPLGNIYSVEWLSKDEVRIEFSREFPEVNNPDKTFNIGVGQFKDIEFKIGLGNELSDIMIAVNYTHDGGDRSFITLRGVSPEIYGQISIYGRNTGKAEESIRLIGGVLRPNPFLPIVLTENIIRGTVQDKFVGDLTPADVVQWPRLDLERLGITGNFTFFEDKIEGIAFASTAQVGASEINYGTVKWQEIITAIRNELANHGRSIAGDDPENIKALEAAFGGTGLFEPAQVRENVPVALENIQINRGLVPPRPFDGTRTVQDIARHISLDFEIKMANGSKLPKIEQLVIQLPLDILRHDRAELSASFVHIDGHNHFSRVHEAVVQAAQGLEQTLSQELLEELTHSILAQSAQANGLYDGTITLALTGVTPTIIGELQSVPNKTFDNTNDVVGGQEEYMFEFAIKGANTAGGGEVRFATATLVIDRADLKFNNSHVGRHKILVQPYVYKSLVFTAGAEDLFSTVDLPAFLDEYEEAIRSKIQTLAEQGGLFVDANINQRQVSWTAGRVADKTYDGSTSVTGIVAPQLTGFVDGDTNIIEVDFGNLQDRLQFANSLPGTWDITGLNFNTSMLTRHDQVAGTQMTNYVITNEPVFESATISTLILEEEDFDRLMFTRGEISRQYNATKVYDYSLLSPLTLEGIKGITDNHTYRFVFYDTSDELSFESRHVTDGFVPVRVTSDFGLQRSGVPREQSPVQLSPELRDYLRDRLFYGEITPRQVYWGLGQVADKDYDGTVSALVTVEPQLIPLAPTSSADFVGIHEYDKTGDNRVVLQMGSAEFVSEDVAHNEYGDVTPQSVHAIGEWSIGGGAYRKNYELVSPPSKGTKGVVGFDLPSRVFGQSVFTMPEFFTAELKVPAFAAATIRPLEVQFRGLDLIENPIRTYTGQPIAPELSDWDLPTLRTVKSDKQDLLEYELAGTGRIEAFTGGLIHKQNTQVGTARTALDGAWGISGTHHTNYRLIAGAEAEWQIVTQKVTSWDSDQVAGAEAGLASKIFDDTDTFSAENIHHLPRLNSTDLDIDAWELSFNAPDVREASHLTIGNPELVREQLNDLLGPNQELADDFDFTSLFEGIISPRVLRWENGRIPSRRYNGDDEIIGDITLPSLVASEAGHEILNEQVHITYDPTLLENLSFPDTVVGSYSFDWYEAILLDFDFIHERHKENYIVLDLPLTWASILPANIEMSGEKAYAFEAHNREYDGNRGITLNEFVATIGLAGGYDIEMPYRVEGLRFKEIHAGTDELIFDRIVFDEKEQYFEADDIVELRGRIEEYIRAYRDAQITPRIIDWTVGQVFDKEWDGTTDVHGIRRNPELVRSGSRLEGAIVERDREAIEVVAGWAQFDDSGVGNNIAVDSDGHWNLTTSDSVNHPLSNYAFGTHGGAGIVPQPYFESANIKQVSVIDVRPMPENREDMEANVFYIRSGYIERQYTGNAWIDIAYDMREEPEFALLNAQNQLIELSLDDLLGLSARFADKDVAYDNGAVTNKEIIASFDSLRQVEIQLSPAQISSIQELLFTGRITPLELREADIKTKIDFVGNRSLHQFYNGGIDWLVPVEEDPDNAGESIKLFPEVGIEILDTGEIIPIRFDDDEYEIRFADRHVGQNKQVSIAGFYLDSRNVTLHEDLEAWMSHSLLTGDISPLTIRWTQGQVRSREYDGTTEAEITVMPILPILDIDKAGITFHTGTASFSEVNVRFDEAGSVTSLPVQASAGEWGISGRYSGNYLLTASDRILPTSQAFETFSTERPQRVDPLFDEAAITPRQIAWTEGRVADKEWDDSYDVDEILQLPQLVHSSGDAIVARDEGRITVEEGWARFTQKEIGEDIPVVSDDNWNLTTSDAVNHPLSNYTFGTPEEAGLVPQPNFAPANIHQVSIKDVRPMPENPDEMEVNVLYIKAGYIERQYNGDNQINRDEDIQESPVFALYNEAGKETQVSLENLTGLQVRFQDKDVAFDGDDITDKALITSISSFNHESVRLSPEQLGQLEELLFTGRITPIRLSFNGRKIAERVFNYDYYFIAEDKSYEYGMEGGFDDLEKWIDIETGETMDVFGDYYLTITFIDQMSRLANGQPHVAEDELVFVDEQGNEVLRTDVSVELRDEEGNVNRNYEYVFDENVETIGRITRAQGLPVSEPQVAQVSRTQIELAPSHIAMPQPLQQDMPFVFQPFAFKNAATGLGDFENLFASVQAFDPGPYVIEYAISRTDNPENLDWQTSTRFTGLLPDTEYFLFARQALHHNRYEGEISESATVVTLRAEDPDPIPIPTPDPDSTPTPDKGNEGAALPRTGDRIGSGLGILGLVTLAGAAILRKKNKKE